MDKELLAAGNIDVKDFPTFLKAYTPPSRVTTLVLLEYLPQRVVRPEERQDLLHFAEWHPELELTPSTSGRIFHEYGELRWEKLATAMRIIYTGNAEYKPDFQTVETQSLDLYAKTTRKYFLFGKRLHAEELQMIGPAVREGDFAEVRIPRILRYPNLSTLHNAERVQLAVQEYTEPATGHSVAYRFYSLVPFQKAEE